MTKKKKQGTYFFGRVIKVGILANDNFITALKDGSSVNSNSYRWMITDSLHKKNNEFEFFYGKLSKYSPEGETSVIDEDSKLTRDDLTENLAIASAPFVYIPEFSGICYLRIWNQIDQQTLKNRLKDIVTEYFDKIFVDMDIKDISETIKFKERVKEFTSISKIQCQINQPNPLYGDIWKHLKDYLINRKSKDLKITEEAKGEEGILTRLNSNSDINDEESVNIIDAGIYMALDGYGEGKITGKVDGKEKTISTKSNAISLKYDTNPDPDDFAQEVYKRFQEMHEKRGLKH